MTEAEAEAKTNELIVKIAEASDMDVESWRAYGKKLISAALLAASRPGKGERARVCEIVKRAINRRIGPWEATDEILAASAAKGVGDA